MISPTIHNQLDARIDDGLGSGTEGFTFHGPQHDHIHIAAGDQVLDGGDLVGSLQAVLYHDLKAFVLLHEGFGFHLAVGNALTGETMVAGGDDAGQFERLGLRSRLLSSGLLGLGGLDSVPLQEVLPVELEGCLHALVDLGVSLGHALSVDGLDVVDYDAAPLGVGLFGDFLGDGVPAGGCLSLVVDGEVDLDPFLQRVLFLLGNFHLHSSSSIVATSSAALFLMAPSISTAIMHLPGMP